MSRAPRRRYAVPLAATIAIVVGVVQVPFWGSVRAWGDSWGGFLAGVGLIALTGWAVKARAEAASLPPATRPSNLYDAIGAAVPWLFGVVWLVLVVGALVGGIAWVAVRAYRLLP